MNLIARTSSRSMCVAATTTPIAPTPSTFSTRYFPASISPTATGDAGTVAAVPAGRIGDPAGFGKFVAFLCSESANYVTGTAVPVDGGANGGLQ